MRFPVLDIFYRGSDRLFLLLVLMTAATMSNYANAYDWNTSYGANASLGYDDNYRLTETEKVDTTTGTVGVSANLDGTTEVSSLNLSVGADTTEYSDASIAESDQYRILLSTSHRGERFTNSLGVSFDSESTAQAELLDSGFTGDGTRDTLSVTPNVSYAIDELNSFSANLQHQDVSYDTVSLTDYVNNAVTLSWLRQINENSSISANLSLARYEPDDADETDTESVFIGYNWRSSSATGYTLSLGYSDVDRPNSRDSGGNYSFAINHQTDELNSFNRAVGARSSKRRASRYNGHAD